VIRPDTPRIRDKKIKMPNAILNLTPMPMSLIFEMGLTELWRAVNS
jgi:hypothetical protein